MIDVHSYRATIHYRTTTALPITLFSSYKDRFGQDVSIMISPAKSTERGSTWIGESHSNTRIAALEK